MEELRELWDSLVNSFEEQGGQGKGLEKEEVMRTVERNCRNFVLLDSIE